MREHSNDQIIVEPLEYELNPKTGELEKHYRVFCPLMSEVDENANFVFVQCGGALCALFENGSCSLSHRGG